MVGRGNVTLEGGRRLKNVGKHCKVTKYSLHFKVGSEHGRGWYTSLP
jgi:hypothetical protein